MSISVHFYSYFQDLTGCAQTSETVAEGGTLADLLKIVFRRFPKLAAMERSMLVAVGCLSDVVDNPSAKEPTFVADS